MSVFNNLIPNSKQIAIRGKFGSHFCISRLRSVAQFIPSWRELLIRDTLF